MAQLSELITSPSPREPSLWNALEAAVEKYAEAPAVTCMHQSAGHLAGLLGTEEQSRSGRWLSWTFPEIRSATLRLAQGMVDAGVQRGQTIVTLLPNGIETVLMAWTAALLQLTLSPLDPSLVVPGREEQLQGYLLRLKPDIIVVPDADAEMGALYTTLKDSRCGSIMKFGFSGKREATWYSLQQLARSASASSEHLLTQDPAVEKDGERTALILFTSGTSSGRPKGAVHTANSFLSSVMQYIWMTELESKTCMNFVNFRAIYNVVGWASWVTGGEMIMPSASFSASSTLDAFEYCGTRQLLCIPVQVQLLAQDPSFKARNPSSLSRIMLGGDMVTIDVVQRAKDTFPKATIVVVYGMTETSLTLGLVLEADKAAPHHRGIVSVGTAGGGSLIRIVDDDDHVVSRGVSGHLLAGGQAVISRYLDDEQPEAFVKDERGSWLRTGDRAVMSEDGNVTVIGRTKDIIKRLGASLSPAVIEAVMNKVPGVTAAVFAVPSEAYGELPMAVIKQERDREELKDLVRDKLGVEFALDGVVTLKELGFADWPYNETGKIQKLILKQKYLQSRSHTNGYH